MISSMRVSFLGASGRSGRVILKRLLDRKHKVKALVRDPSKIKEFFCYENLEVLQGDACSKHDLDKLIRGTDAVLSTLGHSHDSPKYLQRDSINIVIKLMKKYNVNRIIVLTGAGVFLPKDKPNLTDNILLKIISFFDKYRVKDAEAMTEIIMRTQLNWTIVRTYLQHNFNIKNGNINVGYLGDKKLKLHCSRSKISDFITSALEGDLYSKDYPTISD